MKVYLFIDGTNLYAAQYELFGPRKYLDFGLLIKELEKQLKVKLSKIYFYASYSPKPKKPTRREKSYLKNEGLFYRSVKETKKVIFFKGYRSKTSGKEKEVDVKLSVDIVDFAHRNKYDVIYLFSGDADFLQTLFAIKSLKKKIYVVSIQNKILYRATFFFKTYILDFGRPIRLKFRDFQKKEIIKMDKEKLLKELE